MQKIKWLAAGLMALVMMNGGNELRGQTVSSQDSLSGIRVELSSGQIEPLSLNATDMRVVRSLSETQLAAFVLALDATPILPFANQPRKGMAGTFYSLQHPEWPPLPANTSQSAVWQMNDFYLLNDVNFNYNAPVKSQTTMQAMSLSGPPGPGGGGGTNVYFPNGSSYTIPDYGTNLWIAQVAITNGHLAAVASNTLADVQYEILTNADLSTTNWGSTSQFFLGVEDTNWTPFTTLPASRTNNLFYRLRSWASSDGSGLPDWFEQQYGVSDPYGDPDGDGWNNLQEYQNGTSPLVFDQPPAPQGLTVSYDAVNNTATLNWLPAPGPVTGYTMRDSDDNTLNISSGTTLQVSVDNLPNGFFPGDPTINKTFQVQASYAAGNSAWSGLVPLELSAIFGQIVPGPSNSVYLAVSGLPANAVILHIKMIDEDADLNGDYSHDSSHDVPVSALTNGLFRLPTDWPVPIPDGSTFPTYYYWLQTSNLDGSVSAGAFVENPFPDFFNTEWNLPFYDGRVQLKQNLIFQFRIADNVSPFGFMTYSGDSVIGYSDNTIALSPTSYVYAGFYDINNSNRLYGTSLDWPALNIFRPFEDNYLYRNFVYDSAELDLNGLLTTGVETPVGSYQDLEHLGLHLPPTYQPTTNVVGIGSLLTTNTTRWLCTYSYMPSPDNYSVEGFSYDDSYNLNFSNNAVNYWGLPFVSAKVFYYDGNDSGFHNTIMNPGDTLTYVGPTAIYMETAQPQFQTAEYDFWQNHHDFSFQTNSPGSYEFSPTNASDLMMVGVGQSVQISAYAKLALQNGYAGVYGYLAQYLDKAYQVDDNGYVTTNLTGVVSPYGTYFSTDVGVAALVTMPDPDTGERGTCAVYSVSLQLDKNHDGIMDSSFNGPDATSETSPMVCWVNNGQTVAGTSGGLDKDLPVPPNHPEQENEYAGKITCQRDLENFFRLWIRGVPQLPAAQGYTVTFSLTALSGNPAINLYLSSDSAGGTGYLTDTNAAAEQARTEMSPNPAFGVALATINAQQSYTLPSDFFDYHYPYYSRFLFEGAGIGLGQLTMTISQNSNVIVQASAYLDLHDVKDLYEQAHITNVATTYPAMVNSTNASGYALDHQLPLNSAEMNQMIVFVHGWRMTQFDYQSFSDSMFKRLYWTGYQGRFAALRWPTLSMDTTGDISQYFTYNRSEHIAFDSATGASAYFDSLKARFPGYSINVAAHSMGNIVMMETLKNQLAAGHQAIDNYVLMQAAVPAHCYDTGLANYGVFTTAEASHPTPDVYRGYPGSIGDALNGQMVNFFNTNDYALAKGTYLGLQVNWEKNQVDNKPDLYWSYYYDGTTATCLYGNPRVITNPHELMPFVSRPRSKAVGALEGVNGVIHGGELDLTGALNFQNDVTEHSAQFNWSIQKVEPFYRTLLSTLFSQTP